MPTADTLIRSAESLDSQAHHVRPDRGRWLMPPLQLLTGATVVLARRLERANR